MIKSELAVALLDTPQAEASEKSIALCGVKALLEQMSNTLQQGGRIEVRGFGSFDLHYRPSRHAHNPKTGERLVTQAKYSVHFKPGKEMQDRVNALAYHYPLGGENEE